MYLVTKISVFNENSVDTDHACLLWRLVRVLPVFQCPLIGLGINGLIPDEALKEMQSIR